jgi:hypothetical protein
MAQQSLGAIASHKEAFVKIFEGISGKPESEL